MKTATQPEWKLKLIEPVRKAVYDSAVGLTDEEILRVVEEALLVARRHLSS